MIPPMHDQLIPELEHLPANITNMTARNDRGRTFRLHARRSLLLFPNVLLRHNGDIILHNVVLDISHVVNVILHDIILSGAVYFILKLAENFVVRQQLVQVVYVDFVHVLDHFYPESFCQVLVLKRGCDFYDATVSGFYVHQVRF